MKIIFIVPYLGAWPQWMRLFIESCRRNSRVNWILLGDQEVAGPLPGNVTFRFIDKDEICERFRQATGLEINFSYAYKLCDLKPFYGLIFGDLLSDADFWGHTDVDLAYGDLSKIIDPDLLSKWDILTPYKYSCGHLQLYRNTPEINRLALEIPRIEDAMKCVRMVSVTEPGMTSVFLQEVPRGLRWFHINDYSAEIQSRKPMLGATIMPTGEIDGLPLEGDEWYLWADGKVVGSRRGIESEYLYLHWFQWKDRQFWSRLSVTGAALNSWYLTISGFQEKLTTTSASLGKLKFDRVCYTFKNEILRPLLVSTLTTIYRVLEKVSGGRLRNSKMEELSDYVKIRKAFVRVRSL